MAFTLRGDIWIMPAAGGKGRRVTSGPGKDEYFPLRRARERDDRLDNPRFHVPDQVRLGMRWEVPDPAYDDGDSWLFARTVDAPLEYLENGKNTVQVDFDSDGGELVTATLVITQTMDNGPSAR